MFTFQHFFVAVDLTAEAVGLGLDNDSSEEEAEGAAEGEDADEDNTAESSLVKQDPEQGGEADLSQGVSDIQQGVSMLTTSKVCRSVP